MLGEWHKWLGVSIFMLAIASIVVGLQTSVGNLTIYDAKMEAKREALHNAILAGKLPEGETWDAAGARTTNLRIGVVYLAQGMHEASGWRLSRIYILIDTVFLWIALVALFFYLGKWVPDTYCLIGVLYLCAILPLTYMNHYFHPWDRPQLVLWILLLYLVRERRPALLGACLAASMLVKFDTMVVPGLYFLAHVSRDRWLRVTAETIGLTLVVLVTYCALIWMFAADSVRESVPMLADPTMTRHNLETFRSMTLAYPPLLFHGLLFVLAFIGLRARERFVQASVVFAIGILILLAYSSFFEEVRAQTMVTVLLLPAALLTLRDLLERRAVAPADGA